MLSAAVWLCAAPGLPHALQPGGDFFERHHAHRHADTAPKPAAAQTLLRQPLSSINAASKSDGMDNSEVCKRSERPSQMSISAEDAIKQCPQAMDGSSAWKELHQADATDQVVFGRATKGAHQGSCTCKFCEGIETKCQPANLVTAAAADDGTPTCFHVDEEGEGSIAGYECGFQEDRAKRRITSADDVKDAIETCFRPEDREQSGLEKVVFLLGDSHAQNLVPALTAATHGKAQLRMLTAPGIGFCDDARDAIVEEDQHTAFGGNFTGAVPRFRSAVLKELDESLKPGDIVVIHNFYDNLGTSATCMDSERAAEFYEKEVVNKLVAPRKATLMLFSDWAHFGCDYKKYNVMEGFETKYDADSTTFLATQPAPYQCLETDVPADARAEKCFYHREWGACATAAKPMEHRQRGFQQLAARHPSVQFHDLYGLFVDPDTNVISMNVPGTNVNWMYNENIGMKKPRPYDGFSSHLNMVGALYLWPHLCHWLDSAWAAMEKPAVGKGLAHHSGKKLFATHHRRPRHHHAIANTTVLPELGEHGLGAQLSNGKFPDCRPDKDSYWLVASTHKTGTELLDGMLALGGGWNRFWNDGSSISLPECLQFMEEKETETNPYEQTNVKLSKKCIHDMSQNLNMLRSRVFVTTGGIWKDQLDAFTENHPTKKLRAVMFVRDPVEIILSGYFYNVAGKEPKPLAVPSVMLERAQNAACAEGDFKAGSMNAAGYMKASGVVYEELCDELKKFSPAHNTFQEALMGMPPKFGVLAEGLNALTDLAALTSTTEALKNTPTKSALFDLNAVMGDFNHSIKKVYEFLGVAASKLDDCVESAQRLDVAGQPDNIADCLGTDHAASAKVAKMKKKLAHSDTIETADWYVKLVMPMWDALPTECVPQVKDESDYDCSYEERVSSGKEPHCKAAMPLYIAEMDFVPANIQDNDDPNMPGFLVDVGHGADGWLGIDVMKSALRDVLKESDVFADFIQPLRERMMMQYDA